LGPYQGQIRAISEPHQSHIRATSGPDRGQIGARSGPNRGQIRATLGPYQGHVGATSGPDQGHIGATSGPYRSHIGAISGPDYRNLIGQDRYLVGWKLLLVIRSQQVDIFVRLFGQFENFVSASNYCPKIGNTEISLKYHF